jgi:hypothetical protein
MLPLGMWNASTTRGCSRAKAQRVKTATQRQRRQNSEISAANELFAVWAGQDTPSLLRDFQERGMYPEETENTSLFDWEMTKVIRRGVRAYATPEASSKEREEPVYPPRFNK